MPRRDRKKSRVEGLYKRCQHLSWEKCACPWWGRAKRERVSLEKWARTSITSKELAKAVLARLDAAVRNGTFDPRGEHPESITSATPFSDFLDEWVKEHFEAKSLRSDSLLAYVGVFRAKFGNEKLSVLASDPSLWERWLNECRTRGTASEDPDRKREKWSDATYARYVQFGRALFNWAKRRKMVPENPFDVLDTPSVTNNRETRISPEQEQKLFAACDLLDEPPKSKLVKVTPELLAEVRLRAEGGELQKNIAASTGLSRPLVCQIVNGRVWNSSLRKGCVGREMNRRLIAAIDLGLRQGEMLRLQVKHVDYTNWVLKLPATITKSKKDQQLPIVSERLKRVVNERRSLGPDAYLFGKQNGRFVASFDKSWKRLFTVAGLSAGRMTGYVWHDLRHEYVSYLADEGAAIHELKELARHSDIRTTARYLKARDERKRELLRKIGSRLR
jgi:integrase